MTFDLLFDPETEEGRIAKIDQFELWVRRVYNVSSILSIPYKDLWELPEAEFLILERIAEEELQKREARIQGLQESQD